MTFFLKTNKNVYLKDREIERGKVRERQNHLFMGSGPNISLGWAKLKAEAWISTHPRSSTWLAGTKTLELPQLHLKACDCIH